MEKLTLEQYEAIQNEVKDMIPFGNYSDSTPCVSIQDINKLMKKILDYMVVI